MLIKKFNNENIEFIGNFIFSDTYIILVFRFISKNFDSIKSFLSPQNYEPPSLYYSNIDSNSILIISDTINDDPHDPCTHNPIPVPTLTYF